MENNTKEIKYVTPEELDIKLDEKFKEHAGIIVSAVDTILDKRLAESESRLGKKIDNLQTDVDELQTNVGKLQTNVGELQTNVGKIQTNVDELQTNVDWLVKKQTDSEDENIIAKEETKQMKTAFKEKLGVEIRAV